MKQLLCVLGFCCLLGSASSQSLSITITTDKTTSLVFPFAIRHVDRGTRDILVQPVKESENMLLIKAARLSFPETNLSVFTEDGTVYSLVVNYSDSPESWVYYLPVSQKTAVSTYANGILDNPRTMHGVVDKSWDMTAEVAGIYIQGEVIYYQLKITNQSPIDYDIEVLRFFIKDKRKGKRTAVQELDLTPIYVAGNSKQIKANSQTVVVVALEKFTIPDAKSLRIQIMEKNGGRHLSLRIGNRKIIQARVLPDLK